MADPVEYASFMIRMWRDPAAAPDGEVDAADRDQAVWVGEIESVQSGRVVSFRGLEVLAELLVGQLTDAADLFE